MARRGLRHPDCPPLVVNAVPDPPCAGHFELPLIHRASTDGSPSQFALQGMLTRIAATRILGDPIPGHARIRRSNVADVIPPPGCVTGREPEVPSASPRWRSNPLFPFGHERSVLWRSNAPTGSVDRFAEASREFGVGVNFRRGSPLMQYLNHGCEVVDIRGGD